MLIGIETDLLDEETRVRVREHTYKRVAPWITSQNPSDTVVAATIYEKDLDAKRKSFDYKTWACHHVISTFSPGGLALFSPNRPHRMKSFDPNKESHKAYTDYFVSRSPFAPYILSTPDEYRTYGILFDCGVPANLMASMCISSRFIYNNNFMDNWFKLAKLLENEDDAYLFAHYLNFNDAKTTVTLGSSGDHGTFRSHNTLSGNTFWSWFNKTPSYTNHIYRKNCGQSTNHAVYHLFDEQRSGTRPDYDYYFFSKFLTNWVKTYGKAKEAKLEGLNPFQKAFDYIKSLERKAESSGSFTAQMTPEVGEAIRGLVGKLKVEAATKTSKEFEAWFFKFSK